MENKCHNYIFKMRLPFGLILLLSNMLILFLIIGIKSIVPMSDMPHGSHIKFASVVFWLLFIWSIWSWKKVSNSLFDPYVLFLIAAYLFNGGHVLLEIFNANEYGVLKGVFPAETTLNTIYIVMICLASFHFGALLNTILRKKDAANKYKASKNCKFTQTEIRITGCFLLLISLIPTIIILKDNISIVLSSGYFGLYQREIVTGFDTVLNKLATFLVPASLFMLAGSKGNRTGILVSALVILTYSGIQFFLGHRAYAVMPLIAYAWLWHYTIHPLPKVLLSGVALFILFVIFPLVRVVRNIAGYDRLSLYSLKESSLNIENPIVMIISEMGGSMSTIAYTLEFVPEIWPYEMGISYLYAFATLIPNLFWDIHPTIARGLAADRLVWAVDPSFAARGGGLGYSFVAEAYLNFGWLGAPIFMVIIGFLFVKLLLWATQNKDAAKMAMVASFLSFFLFYARGESASYVRSLVWYSLLPYLGIYMTKLFLTSLKVVTRRVS